MNSELIDQMLRTYLEVPVRFSWKGEPADLVRGVFEDIRLDFGGIATRWMNLQHVTVHAARIKFIVGAPLAFEVERPRVELTIGQRDIDPWINRSELPFQLTLGEAGLIVNTRLARFEISEIETRLRVTHGWFALEPQRASVLGVSGQVPSFLRGYLPLPRLSSETRIVAIDHASGTLGMTLEIDDFKESVTPGLVKRMTSRVVPFSN